MLKPLPLPLFSSERPQQRIVSRLPPAFDRRQSYALKSQDLNSKTSYALLVVNLNNPALQSHSFSKLKLKPCAKTICWIDTEEALPRKLLQYIEQAFTQQYEGIQSKLNCKFLASPMTSEVKKICTGLRKKIGRDRVLIHYIGAPVPTINGEVWMGPDVPISVADIMRWTGSKILFVFDCSQAGRLIEQLLEDEDGKELSEKAIVLAACGKDEELPMYPKLPADLFTCCLTTPLKMAIKYHMIRAGSITGQCLSEEQLENMPGDFKNRKTIKGELNWILTAITDTIAWNSVDSELFKKIFRQDVILASMFRNFLLAERVMMEYDCHPIAYPEIRKCKNHPLWGIWDHTLDVALSQYQDMLEFGTPYKTLPFFDEQIQAFEIWLKTPFERRRKPEQLPILLQLLLSPVYRRKSLELMADFLAEGRTAVNMALSLDIFPYLVKLLQSAEAGVKTPMLKIWTHLLAEDINCRESLFEDTTLKYFRHALEAALQGEPTDDENCANAAFVLARMVKEYPEGQCIAIEKRILPACFRALDNPHSKVRQWSLICLGFLWKDNVNGKLAGIKEHAETKLLSMLEDDVSDVRVAAVFAIGTFLGVDTPESYKQNEPRMPKEDNETRYYGDSSKISATGTGTNMEDMHKCIFELKNRMSLQDSKLR